MDEPGQDLGVGPKRRARPGDGAPQQAPVSGEAAEAGLDRNERIRLMRDGILNNTSIFISGLIGIVLVPIMLKGLGSEAYGVWIAALSITSAAGLFDFGLGASLTREVAAAQREGIGDETTRFLKAAGTANLAIGILGALLIATLGMPLSSGLHLSPVAGKIAPEVFALAGVSFLSDRLLAYTLAVLRGMRRFDISNLVSSLAALSRACGIIVLIKLQAGLPALMTWQVGAGLAAALAGQFMVASLKSEFRYRTGRLEWKLVRSHLPFGSASQLTSIMEVMIWDMIPVVVGLVLGSRWIAPFYIAQKFPTAVAPLIWSAAEALFPAVSQHRRDEDMGATRAILEAGTRWIVALALPLCAGLWLIAPELLGAWVGNVDPGAVLVMRLITAAMFLEGIAAAPVQVLWGRGELRPLLLVPSCILVASLGLTLGLLPRLGMVGAAWGLLLPTLVGAAAYFHVAAEICGVRVLSLLGSAFRGLALPVLAMVACVTGVQDFGLKGWPGVSVTIAAGGFVYLLCFFLSGAREEELILTRRLIAALRALPSSAYKSAGKP